MKGDRVKSDLTKNDRAKKKQGSRPPPRTARPRRASLSTASAITPAIVPATVPIVGVGASAGGLEAFKELLAHLPGDTGMAFVLIQHLNPKHRSHLTELLRSTTAMLVSEVRARTRVQADHVYVISAEYNLSVSDGHLSPTKRAASGRNMPINAFLTALAKHRGPQAYGVVLSGTGSDGMLGLKAIRVAGGATFVQQPETAKFPEMPSSAISLGVADFVLPPAEIARQLTALSSSVAAEIAAAECQNPIVYATASRGALPAEPGADPALVRVFQLLRNAGGVDFTHYKHTTIRRRIRRRMALRGFKTLREYTAELARNRDEARALGQDFFITVTGFFRDPEIFLDLKRIVFPALLARRKHGRSPIRIWVPGCATGEEAFSIAICLTEFLEEAGVGLAFQVFATDANEAVIERARAAVYSDTALEPFSSKRRARFFTRTEAGYRVNKNIRDACVFARHNLAKDPPFSRMDLISCCNVLIYLGPVLQNKAVQVFHYALKPEGFLVLGSSESIDAFPGLFQQVSKKNKLYRRNASRSGVLSDLVPQTSDVDSKLWTLQTARALQPAAPKPSLLAAGKKTRPGGPRSAAELRKELAATQKYLRSLVASNEAATQELKSVNEEAQASNQELETAQEELQSVNEELNTLNEDLQVRNVQLGELNLDLANLQESISIPLVMVGKDLRIRRFTRAMMPLLNLNASDVGRPVTDLRPEIELPDLRQRLLAVIAGRALEPEDVRSSNGRWYSRRTLPAVGPNGKTEGAIFLLIDIDAERRGRDFAEAIVEAVHEPLLILRKNLKIIAANKAFYEVFHVSPEETEGREIYDLGDGQWNIPRLRELLHQVLLGHASFRNFEVEHNFQRVGRKVMLLNASEVFDPNAKEQTILLAIEDITDRKRAEEALKKMNLELQHFAYALTHDLREPLRMVVNFTELLAQEYRGKLGLEADQYMEYSVEGAQRMEALMKALLAYWETTAEEHIETPIDCNVALTKTLGNLAAAIKESGAAITCDPLPTVLAQETMVTQVFQNLIANAIKYKSQQPLRIHVSAENGGPDWVFSIRDNGIGIDPQHSERVFGIFKRLHGKEIPGTGIGLALCKKIVERRGGKIWVESALGSGATFKFTIPCSSVPPPATDLRVSYG
jgi:two-component system, chemotaxis family, CheB/CheR fusion protein